MNIYQKLIEVRKSVPYLKKDATGYQFQYVSSSHTLGALREAMDQQQLLLIPRVLKHEISDHTTKKGDHNYFTTLELEFTWVNAELPEETIVCTWRGCGLDDGEKGIGKAVTYGEKYFLLKFFNIATDKDDPDSFQKKQNKDGEGKKQPKLPDRPKEQDEMKFIPPAAYSPDTDIEPLSDNAFKQEVARKQRRNEFRAMLKFIAGDNKEVGELNLFRFTGQTSIALVSDETIEEVFDQVKKAYEAAQTAGEGK